MSILLDEACVRDVLNRFGGGVLRSGGHDEPEWFDDMNGGDPPGECEMCVEELRTLALHVCAARPKCWTDRPEGDGMFEAICRSWNDAVKDDELRTRLGVRLACRSTATAAEGWLDRYRDRFCREVLGDVFDKIAEVVADSHKQPMRDAGAELRAEGVSASENARKVARAAADADDAAAAYAAAAYAAADAAYAATYAADAAAADAAAADAAYAAYAADAAYDADAATYAAYAAADAARNDLLERCALILIECHDGTGL